MKQQNINKDKGGHDPRWPAILNTIAIIGLFHSLPESLSPGPWWLLPSVTLALLCGAFIAQLLGRVRVNFIVGVIMHSFITAAEVCSLFLLVAALPSKRQSAGNLLGSAGALWVSNVLIFASWYWRLDAGGPHRRTLREEHSEGAFLFPQMTLPAQSGVPLTKWKPGFIDYLFLAFTTSTAFSPTDTPVISRWAKAVMMVQATISFGVIAILVARGISLL